MTDRIAHIDKAAQDLHDLCNRPLTTEPDVFGEIETLTGRNQAILRASNNIARMAATSDNAWTRLMVETEAQVRESEHPKHSVLSL